MKRLIALLLIGLLALAAASPAAASNFYIIPDSNSRYLTESELWEWQYDALGYILNEIFARHGYHFEPGGKYDNYFRAQTWYHENETLTTNQQIYDKLVTDVEWHNERLVKDVREEMRALGTTNPGGRPLPSIAYEPPLYGAFSSFFAGSFAPDQRLNVYTGPGTAYYRAANGKAVASTNGQVYVGGWENGWLMVMYWTNNGNIRVGYASARDFRDKIQAQQLSFDWTPATITRHCVLTDDPVETYQTLVTLEAGHPVTLLSEYINEIRWAYIELTVDGQLMRGFVPSDAIEAPQSDADDAFIGRDNG